MENPAYLDSDQSVYERYPPIASAVVSMSQRRPHHLPALHRPPQHTHRIIGMPTAAPNHSAHSTPASTPQQHQHIVFPDPNNPPPGTMYHPQSAAHHHMTLPNSHTAAAAHHSNVPNHHTTLVPNSGGVPMTVGPGGHYRAEPLYSCQAPRGHDHVYQCPGHGRNDHVSHMEQLEQLEQRLDRLQLRRQEEPRSEYQYGGSDYSSTEPIYAQPQHPPGESGHTPTLAYVHTGRTSLRGGVAGGGHGTPARFLVRADSVGASTSSSTLPTVSALLPHDHAHQALDGNKVASSPSTPTPTKLKRQGLLGAWRLKFLRDDNGGGGGVPGGANNSRRKACLLLAALFIVLFVVIGIMAGVLYLTRGGLGAIVGESPKLIEITEKGSKIVTGEFRITNQNFWSGLEDPSSESYRHMATSIEAELDALFESSMWAREYNGSEVVSLSPGSLMVRAHLRLKQPDVDAAHKLGAAFLRGLSTSHKHNWLGPFTIDVNSLRFSEVLVDSPSVSPPAAATTPESSREHSHERHLHQRHHSTQEPYEVPQTDVGWGPWGEWSACSPCSPQYDQIRYRQCRLDGGSGLMVNNIELCLQKSLANDEEPSGEIETRSCQCDPPERKHDPPSTTTTTTTTSAPSTIESILPPYREHENSDQDSFSNEAADADDHSIQSEDSICSKCLPGEVCVALQDEQFPSCRSPRDPTDPTGCGGLCAIDSEVCQSLGSRAFNCHSASKCLEDEWRCADGLCIPNIKRCDGHMNCYDQSDEQNCPCKNGQFQCGNNTSCLPISAKCDGKMDCWDGADELNCANGAAGASHLQTSVLGRNRAVTASMNRTAIGLSSLSHRERELLS